MTVIVGHRGAAGYAPENTLLSFENAMELGCQKTELDVWLSSDGELVVIHDEKVDRVSKGRGLVSSMTLEEIKKLKCPRNQEIPTLQEVIDLCRGRIGLQIELKGPGTPKPVNDLILRNGLDSQVTIISFKPELLQEMKKLNPKLPLGFLFYIQTGSIWKIARNMSYICPIGPIVTAKMVEKAHQLGLKVYAWHVNDKELGARLIKMGVDEIGTDLPRLFI